MQCKLYRGEWQEENIKETKTYIKGLDSQKGSDIKLYGQKVHTIYMYVSGLVSTSFKFPFIFFPPKHLQISKISFTSSNMLKIISNLTNPLLNNLFWIIICDKKKRLLETTHKRLGKVYTP